MNYLSRIHTLALIWYHFNYNQVCISEVIWHHTSESESELLLVTSPNDIHQDLWSGKLVPNPYKRSELSNRVNRVFCTSSSRKERTVSEIQSLIVCGKTLLLQMSVLAVLRGLKCQRVMLSGMPHWGDKVKRMYNGCTLQTFVLHYESTISPSFFRDSHFSCSRMSVILLVSQMQLAHLYKGPVLYMPTL